MSDENITVGTAAATPETKAALNPDWTASAL